MRVETDNAAYATSGQQGVWLWAGDDCSMRCTLLGLALLLHAEPVLAASPAAPHPPVTTGLPTQFSPMSRSLQQLFGDGYQVVNLASGLSGFGYLLKQGSHYVTCAVQPDPKGTGIFLSECRAMN